MIPDRVWLGHLSPEFRRTIREALAAPEWPVRESPCNDTASSLTPKGGLGILILEIPDADSWRSTPMPTLWVVPPGQAIPPGPCHPLHDLLFLPAPPEEVRLRVERLAEQAVLADSIQRLERRLEIETERRTGLTSAVAHDLMNPLTATVEYLELLQDGSMGSIRPEQRTILMEAQSAARRVSRRLIEIREATDYENGVPLHVTPEEIELPELLEKLRDHLPPLLVEKEQRLTARIEPDLASVLGDPSRIEQALCHLIENAARYSPHRAEVQIEAFRDLDANGFVRVGVSDRGVGISYDQIALPDSTDPEEDGKIPSGGRLGIGLTLVRAIAEALGGALIVARRSGGGSRVHLRLPIWCSRTARIAEAQIRLSSSSLGFEDAWLCHASGREEIESLGGTEPWHLLSPGEILVIHSEPPAAISRLGQLREFRRAGSLDAALAPRLTMRPIDSGIEHETLERRDRA